MNTQIFIVSGMDRGKPLLDFLSTGLSLSRRKAKSLLDARIVFVNHKRVWMARHILMPGDEVEIQATADRPVRTQNLPRILFEDHDYIVVDKPSGMVSNGPDSLEQLLRDRLKIPTLVAVHRLDRDTTGCNLFSRSTASRDRIIPLFKDHRVLKIYNAIVLGRVGEDPKEISSPIDGQTAITRIERILAVNKMASHLLVKVDTGRTHQIRKHLASIHHPIVGDKVYTTGPQAEDALRKVRRQMLHASRLLFQHPSTGQKITAQASLPHDFQQCLHMLKLG